MQIKIHHPDNTVEERYISVSTVTLYKEATDTTYPFHCTNCGNTTNIIGGKVTKIYPILEPSDQITVVTTCKSCKAKYTFQDSTNDIDKSVVVLLSPKIERQSFYCYLGGGDTKNINRILDYDTQQNYSYLESSMVSMPFNSHCTNSDCTLVYQFLQFS